LKSQDSFPFSYLKIDGISADIISDFFIEGDEDLKGGIGLGTFKFLDPGDPAGELKTPSGNREAFLHETNGNLGFGIMRDVGGNRAGQTDEADIIRTAGQTGVLGH